MLTTSPAHDPAPLREAMAGQVHAPGEPAWDEARQAWNLSVDQQPALVAVPESIADVQIAVTYARERGMAVTVQGTGHQAAAIPGMQGALLIRTHKLRGVKVDPLTRRALVRAGDVWADVTGPASEYGLAPLAGSSHDVGVVGYTLGGGISWLGRKHGLAANSVTAIAVVLADGRLVRADRDHHADLFWALRGGGGAVGVVVGLEMALYPATELAAGALFFPWERTAEVGHAWREWTQALTDATTSILHVVQVPPFPEIPEPLRGKAFVIVEVAHLGTREEIDALVAPIRALGPVMDTLAAVSPAALQMLHMDPPQPSPGHGDHRLLADLPAEAIDVFAALVDHESGSPLVSAEIRHLGGALGRGGDEHGALDAVPGGWLVFGVGIVMNEPMRAAVATHVAKLVAAFEPYDAGYVYTNFVERPSDTAAKAFDDATWERLRAVKADYDPENVFRVSRTID